MSVPFLILALPRSRTAWLSHFLTYGPKVCEHDYIINCASIEEFLLAFRQGLAGSVETGAMLGWKVLRQRMPTARIVLVRRDYQEAARSLANACGEAGVVLPIPYDELATRDSLLDAISQMPGVRQIRYEELSDESTCHWLFEHCLELPFDRDHWARLASTNIQIDMRSRIELLVHRQPQLEALRAEVIDASSRISGGTSWLGLN